jgi:hypothetical protein
MKRAVLVVLLCLFLMPLSSFAQESVWELSQVVVSEQLGVEFNAPADWTIYKNELYFVVYVAEDAADFPNISDADPLTLPQYAVLSLNASRLDAQTEGMTLTELALRVVDGFGGEIVEQQEVGALASPALSLVVGHETSQRATLMLIWRQSDAAFLFALALPEPAVSEELRYMWEQMTASLRPSGAMELAETASVSFLAFSIDYPLGWSVRVEQRSGFSSLNISEFRGTEAEDGYRVVVWTTRLPESDENTLDSAAERLIQVFDLTPPDVPQFYEFSVLAQRGIGLGWASSTGAVTYVILVPHTPFPELETYYIVSAPTQAALDDFWATWIAMLQSVRLLE